MPKLHHYLTLARRRAVEALSPPGRVARVAFNFQPVFTPWGGGNQFLIYLADFLRFCGYEIRWDLKGEVDCIFLMHFGITGRSTFTVEEAAEYLRARPHVACVHQVNDADKRKGTVEMDPFIARHNALAHHTIFISEWLRDYHAAGWFDRARPHCVITHGVDPAAFHPLGSRDWKPGEPLRLITHHWSDNWMKGFKVYAEVDRLIASGELRDVELWIAGRWPREIEWKAARTFPPASNAPLGELLRQCHGYLTASLWEPGGMHFIEGAQCGLPTVFHEDGGGIVEVARQWGVGFRDDVAGAIRELQARYGELRAAVLARPPSGERQCWETRRVLERTMLERRSYAA